MTIRDLTPEQSLALKTKQGEAYDFRLREWKNATPKQVVIFDAAFVAGVKAAMEVLIP